MKRCANDISQRVDNNDDVKGRTVICKGYKSQRDWWVFLELKDKSCS